MRKILSFLIKLVSCKTCLTNVTKGLKLRQVDKNQSFKKLQVRKRAFWKREFFFQPYS